MRIELKLLLERIRLQPQPLEPSSLQALIPLITDWDFFMELCHRHGLVGIVSKRIAQDSPDLFPTPFLRTLHSSFFRSATRSMALSGTLLEIVMLFSQNDIGALPFKGPLLAQKLYGAIGLRSFGDLDVLIKQDDLHRAATLLGAAGFSPEVPPVLMATVTFSCHEDSLSFFRESDRSTVELHWDMSGCYLASPLAFQDVFQKSHHTSLGGQKIACLTQEDLLVYLCIHGTKHTWERLEWLYSVAILLDTCPNLDWDIILERTTQWQCRRILFLGLHLCHDLLGSSLPPRIQNLIRQEPRVLGLGRRTTISICSQGATRTSAPKERLRFSTFHLLVRDDPWDGLSYGLRLLFRPTVKEWQACTLPPRLTFLYYGLRPLRLAWLLIKAILQRAAP